MGPSIVYAKLHGSMVIDTDNWYKGKLRFFNENKNQIKISQHNQVIKHVTV